MDRLRRLSIPRAVEASARRPGLVVLAAAILCAIAAYYAVGHFDMTSDTAQLISSKVAWRQNEIAMDRAFPQDADTTVVVIDGATPEIADVAAARLFDALRPHRDVIRSVRRPDGGPFFDREGLLLLPTAEVQSATEQLIAAQPFLGALAADPSLRGVMTTLSTLAQGVEQGQTTLAAVGKPIAALADAMQRVETGRPAFFSWQVLLGGGAKTAPLRRFVIVQPRLDFGGLTPGAGASDVIRRTASQLGLDEAHGVRLRLTGSIPLSDEEFASLADRVWLVGGAMLGSMLLMLWLAVRSVKVVGAIVVTTLAGLVMTAAVGLLAVGRFNLISVAFIPLFVGLGVDFGIQLSVRFRAERLVHDRLADALAAAAGGIGRSLVLAAAAIALGFFAFLPTSYIGVSELGVIAGLGMGIGLVLNLTLLPALLVLLKPPRQPGEVGSRRMAPVDRFLISHRKLVLWAFAGSTVVSIALLPLVRFDFNPFHLRNIHGEAMSTLADIMRDPDRTPNTIDALTPSLADADRLAARLSKLPQVDHAVTLSSFVADDQPTKLAAIADAQFLLDLTLNPPLIQPPPTDGEAIEALRKTAADLRRAAGSAATPAAADARRLAGALEALAGAPPALRARAGETLITPLNVLLRQVRDMLSAQPVTLESLPPDLKAEWIGRGGLARVEVSPKGDSNDNATLRAFAEAVRRVAPAATGAPISILEAGRTISWAFIEAGLLSLVAIFLLLLAILRSLREVAFTLAPIVLSGFLTLGTCVVIGQPINFANIIAFPLLFGVGVAFHIYFVMAWRAGAKDLLQSSLARGVFFSAMTTGAAFGSLMFSRHPGTASMGKILMISLIWTLVAALIFEPALLGPPRETKAA
jgi:hopanoid biosynthesis associated RND transporter like protein HpnN